jgi:hypothetical protein
LILGVIWSIYNTNMPINGEYRTLNYIIIVIETIAMLLIIYLFNNRLRNLNKLSNQ